MVDVSITPVEYKPGGTYGICDRCGLKYRLRDLRKEWSGLMVCEADYDPRPDTLNPPRIVPEGLTVPGSRPEQPDTFIQNQVTPDQL